MKQQVADLLLSALCILQKKEVLAHTLVFNIKIEHARDPRFGDFASNIALTLAKQAKMAPRDLAQQIIDVIPENDCLAKIEIAGPGFINFTLASELLQNLVATILQTDHFGQLDIGAGKKILLEFVSANPTGPLHVGHGRGAAYGDSLANLLQFAGFSVDREYYVNDAGRQMDILATSVWLRYLELCELSFRFPANGYQGDYIWDIAATLHRENADKFYFEAALVFAEVPEDAKTEAEKNAGVLDFNGDKEAHIDALIDNAKRLLSTHYGLISDCAITTILTDIKEDLGLFGVQYQRWFSEKSLIDKGQVEQCVQQLQTLGHCYKKAGAIWFRSTAFNDTDDRVLIRANGQMTYFASDVAYHRDKFARQYDHCINIWGADHHGYMARVNAALQALNLASDGLEILLVQFANLIKNGEKVAMSTRSGQYITLRQLRKDIGVDAARYFYVMRKCEQHMDFDLDLATSQNKDNPVYTIQYAHARICRLFERCQEKGWTYDADMGNKNLACLTEKPIENVLLHLAKYPDVIRKAVEKHEPHQVANYCYQLASLLHGFYDSQLDIRILSEDEKLRNSRLNLSMAVAKVLRSGLKIIGVSALEKM